MRKPLLIVLISISGISLQAQTNLDSLYSVWQDATQPDTTRVAAYNDYIWNGFLFSKPDTASTLAEALLAFGQKKQYPKAEANAYNMLGISHSIQGDYPKALDYYQRSIKIREEIGDKKGMANALNNIGIIYDNQGNNSKALDYYQRSLKIMEEIGDKNGIANALNNIGIIYIDQDNSSKALDYFKRGLKIKEEIGDKRGAANGLNNIGSIYDNQGNKSKATDYYQRSVKIMEEIGDERGLAFALNQIGIIESDRGNKPKALDYFKRSLKIMEEIGDKLGITYSLRVIGTHSKDQGHYVKAIAHCKKSLALSQEMGAIVEQKEACQCLYDTYKALGKGNEALKYMELMRVAEDSLNAEETNKQLQQMEFAKQMLADSLQQEEVKLKVEMAHQQEVAKKDKTRNMLIGGGLILLLAAIGFFSRWRYVKKSRDTISKEKDRSENLLLNILPAEIAEELKEKGEAAARDFEMVSILFTDFKGFTQASEKLSATDLVAEINTCFKAFDGIVGKYNIEKIKTIGDAYMCAGGLPVPDDNAVKNTVHAGLEMQAFMIARKTERDAAGLPAFEMRVGIHTGPVVAGIVGVKKFQYDIWGDTVNTASRMESSGDVGQVNISEATYELLKDIAEFTFESRGKIEAKGKGEIEMYFVSKA